MANTTPLLTLLLLTLCLLLTHAQPTPKKHHHKHHHHKPNTHNKHAAHHLSSFEWFSSHSPSLSCPSTNGRTWLGPNKAKFGVLCGWDTKSQAHHWGQMHGVGTFEQCVERCAEEKECQVAEYAKGKCYFKKHGKGKGYVQTGGNKKMVAIKLNHPDTPIGEFL